jgi:PAS domain-containing protein
MDRKPTYEELEQRVRELGEKLIQAEQREQTLKESNESLISLLDGIRAIVYVADMKNHVIIYANGYAKDSFGEGLEGKICKSNGVGARHETK